MEHNNTGTQGGDITSTCATIIIINRPINNSGLHTATEPSTYREKKLLLKHTTMKPDGLIRSLTRLQSIIQNMQRNLRVAADVLPMSPYNSTVWTFGLFPSFMSVVTPLWPGCAGLPVEKKPRVLPYKEMHGAACRNITFLVGTFAPSRIGHLSTKFSSKVWLHLLLPHLLYLSQGCSCRP